MRATRSSPPGAAWKSELASVQPTLIDGFTSLMASTAALWAATLISKASSVALSWKPAILSAVVPSARAAPSQVGFQALGGGGLAHAHLPQEDGEVGLVHGADEVEHIAELGGDAAAVAGEEPGRGLILPAAAGDEPGRGGEVVVGDDRG